APAGLGGDRPPRASRLRAVADREGGERRFGGPFTLEVERPDFHFVAGETRVLREFERLAGGLDASLRDDVVFGQPVPEEFEDLYERLRGGRRLHVRHVGHRDVLSAFHVPAFGTRGP